MILSVLALLLYRFTDATMTTVTLNPTRDNFLVSGSPDINFGIWDGLFVGRANFGVHRGIHRAILLFDIASAVPVGSILVQATLQITVDAVVGRYIFCEPDLIGSGLRKRPILDFPCGAPFAASFTHH